MSSCADRSCSEDLQWAAPTTASCSTWTTRHCLMDQVLSSTRSALSLTTARELAPTTRTIARVRTYLTLLYQVFDWTKFYDRINILVQYLSIVLHDTVERVTLLKQFNDNQQTHETRNHVKSKAWQFGRGYFYQHMRLRNEVFNWRILKMG